MSETKPINIRPLGSNILVDFNDDAPQTINGLVMPENSKKRPTLVKVLAVGPGDRDINGNLHPVDVHAGLWIVISEYAGREVKLSTTEKYLLVNEKEVLGVKE